MAFIREYFGNVEGTPIFAAATLLDPRFKKYGFSQYMRTPIRLSTAIAFVGESSSEILTHMLHKTNE